ncbi:MAG: thiol-disulfide oxidoreductase DCC family protein [Chitinophagales bacterium]|nr:thiol-disulfide oxidoreductase DCC family protein [Chitinophagales bacterium]MDC3209232.1 thiol-disulfide oxidoreductase DCC family protein [Chitinophagales bacterium]
MKYPRVIVFDGVCNLCNSSVQWVLKYDKNARFSFASLQGEFGQNLLKQNALDPKTFHSFILLEGDQLYTQSTAALRVAKKMSFPFFLLYPFILVPKFIRDTIYDYIANNRYKWFGKTESCMIPDPAVQQRFIP